MGYVDVTELWEEEQRKRFDDCFHIAEALPQGKPVEEVTKQQNAYILAIKELRMNKTFDPRVVALAIPTSPELFITYLKKYCEERHMRLTFMTGNMKGCKMVKLKGRPRGTCSRG